MLHCICCILSVDDRRESDRHLDSDVLQKKTTFFYFCNNFFIREPIFIIFDDNMQEKICNKTYIVLPTTPNLYAPTLPCNTSGKSD